MEGDPLVVEGRFGNGGVLLSLIHFDTPKDRNGARVLRNIWEYSGLGRADAPMERKRAKGNRISAELLRPAEELMEFGRRNFLWYADGWITRWRRGIRGLEYLTLYEVVKELSRLAGHRADGEALRLLAGDIAGFAEKAKRLLLMERLALQEGERLTFSNSGADSSSMEIAALRAELFGGAKSHGGKFKQVLDRADALLFGYLKTAR
jgi:hypothetical protein